MPAEPPIAEPPIAEPPAAEPRELPLMCTGCGAFSQTSDPLQLGYFDLESKRVRKWLNKLKRKRLQSASDQDKIVEAALQSLESAKLEELGLNPAAMTRDSKSQTSNNAVAEAAKPPVCDRCHDLLNFNATGLTAKTTMYHPTVEALRKTIKESPYAVNHIIHVIDAADFPMSLVPRLNALLGYRMRSKNRRSRPVNPRGTIISFFITRADLLGPTKQVVDSKMPYLKEVLREAIGRNGDRVRLGHVKCVSAKRAWWTKAAKAEVLRRGGAAWLIGKVNVGKSQLFEAIFPKGMVTNPQAHAITTKDTGHDQMGELLPPARPVENYPAMPTVSSLPGTTASPIRIPYGDGRGELIDLPGMARSDLEYFVKEEHRPSLMMKDRIVPEQRTVGAGRSLLLGGGLIRITPRTENMDFLMYNFTPLDDHLTSTEKAIEVQTESESAVKLKSIMRPGTGLAMKLAGTFQLRHDVTKNRSGPLTQKAGVGLRVANLPFRVVSLDILIEGVGYVEIVAQIRAQEFAKWKAADQLAEARRQLAEHEAEALMGASEQQQAAVQGGEFPKVSDDPFAELWQSRRDNNSQWQSRYPVKPSIVQLNPTPEPPVILEEVPDWPAVDVFTPQGRFVGSRRPINGWENNKPRVLEKHKKSRPRRSMKGQKKLAKEAKKKKAARPNIIYLSE